MQPTQPIQQFINDSGAATVLEELKQYFADNKPNGLIVSDVLDDEGNQYVDLVQEGGGVWGVALVGYTYIMEEMGIRFFSLAGTSAGAINTMMLAVAGNAADKKYITILDHMLKLPLDQLVDGQNEIKDGKVVVTKYTRFIRWLVKNLIIKSNFIKKLIKLLRWLMVLFITLSVGSFIGNFLIDYSTSKWLGLTPLLLLVLIFLLLAYSMSKFKDFLDKGIGLNEGKFFHNWLNNVIAGHTVDNDANGQPIINLEHFHRHFSRPVNLRVRPGREDDATPPAANKRMICIITCDITSKNKIMFPRMWDLYWKDKASVHPGDMVRASMSIPGFFKMFHVKVHEPKSEAKKDAWKRHLGWDGNAIPDAVNFVDGGAISNFPLNVFFNPNYPVPRMPTFGARLDSDDGTDTIAEADTIAEYAGAMLSSIRGYYDKDFILRNPSFQQGICCVNLKGHSSVNFFMDEKGDTEKKQLFLKGAMAAAAFLKTFDWEKYKTDRAGDISKIDYTVDPNNLEDPLTRNANLQHELTTIKNTSVRQTVQHKMPELQSAKTE
ncbi:patatin-like phospholipase family protein [Panacibacter sp. DH6]|uniref:Patatin-like phospholipase family protein n=1 Tax=Panacibacter microcysteis TaxID=2793269 RepID=A0A931E258_9BACT|nr:patatin-like phospholipase family protein [Panacibacter microcysteis]MBG9377182.1 patatin-like phospholipase family protein [Panacibacter microcysteis]